MAKKIITVNRVTSGAASLAGLTIGGFAAYGAGRQFGQAIEDVVAGSYGNAGLSIVSGVFLTAAALGSAQYAAEQASNAIYDCV